MTSELISEYDIFLGHLTLYNNRIEIKRNPLTEIIIIRNITSIDENPFNHSMVIKTSDKKNHPISMKPSDIRALKEQIMSLL